MITSYEELLERVDEYSLYRFYLGFSPELDMSYRSPIREGDLNPSWSLFPSKYIKNREFMWKDKGGGGCHGDVFKLVRMLFGYTNMWQVLARIKGDFDLGPKQENKERVIRYSAPTPSPGVDIRIKSRAFDRFDLNWWKNWNVTKSILEEYKAYALKYYWKYIHQDNPMTPKDPSYAYNVMGKYKLYFPFERAGYRFRTDMTDLELEGFMQLRYDTPLLVITKSMKDIMCLRSFGYDAVSPRGESTLIPGEFLSHFEEKYQHIVTLFDNDGKHKAAAYSYPELHIPITSGQKDPTDFCKRYGPKETGVLLHQLFSPWALSA